MAVLMFQHRFAPLVESCQKRQTIRPKRRRPIKAGDKLSLRQWTGAAYRSKQRVLRDATCSGTNSVTIRGDGEIVLLVEGEPCLMAPGRKQEFAVADGFASADDMVMWFNNTHGLPFEGALIRW